MVRRAFRASFIPAVVVAVLGALAAGGMIALSRDEGFDHRSWFVIGVGAVMFLGGLVGAILAVVRWRDSGSHARAITTGGEHIVWAYARNETTVVHGMTGEAGRRVELGVTIHFDDGRRIDLPDDGSDSDELLAWIHVRSPGADIGYSLPRQMKHGVRRA